MKKRACRATDGDRGKKVHAKTEIAEDCKNWERVSESERDQRRQTKTSREGRMRESVRQRGTNRYRDSWTAGIRRRRGSDCPLSSSSTPRAAETSLISLEKECRVLSSSICISMVFY